MQRNPTKKSFLQKQLPTILGLTILAFALIGGIFFLGDTTVFTPRAAPEATPKNVQITNVTDAGFTVTFLTDGSTSGFVKYGTSPNSLNAQTSDDRDQLTGSIGQYQTHHITVRGLQPNTTYYYTIGTGGLARFDDDGQAFSIQTGQRNGSPGAAQTIYGNVSNGENAALALNDMIMYAEAPDAGIMSTLVKNSGSWAIPLSNARAADGSGYATIAATDQVTLSLLLPNQGRSTVLNTTVADAQPAETIAADSAAGGSTQTANTNQTPAPSATPMNDQMTNEENSESEVAMVDTEPAAQSSAVGGLATLATATSSDSASTANTDASSSANTTATGDTSTRDIDFTKGDNQVVVSGKPTIRGQAAPNATIRIQVNSETQINQQLVANSDGTFELDMEQLSSELEPGEHTATYSYTNPDTGEVVTETINFTVDPDATPTDNGTGGVQLAQAQASPTPFGSANPYTLDSGSSSASASPSASPSPATSSGSKGGTRSAVPATDSAIPVSGAVGTTVTLVLGGIFFILAGVWSFWMADQWETAVASAHHDDDDAL